MVKRAMSRVPTDLEIIAAVADELPVGVWVARAPGGEFVYANRTFAEIMGQAGRTDVAVGEYAAPYGIYGRDGKLYPEGRMPFVRALEQRTTVIVDDIVIHRADGRQVYIRASAKPVFDAAGTLTHVVIAFIDITREVDAERARAESEARLQRAQRMESIGKLAGGIAHDFNNLLASIKLVASGLRRSEADPEKLRDLELVDEVTERAVQLTRALVGFAGRGKNLAQRVSINQVVRSMGALLRRTIDQRIVVAIELGASRGDVIGDVSQLEQIVMNLGVNARDAMPDGGRMVLATADVVLDEESARALPPLRPGPYVLLEVADDGAGIDPAIRDRIFEPYFTTKAQDASRGSGLGLATVYGIVESHHGAIEVRDGTPRGTRMRILLPAAPPAERSTASSAARPAVRMGRGTVLLVEDDPLVRLATRRALESIGYAVVSAADGAEAVELFRPKPREFAVVMLDMVMPRMDGRATYLALRAIRADVPVLLTTGYARNEEVQAILDLGVRAFLPKPADVESLSAALARLIESTP